MDFFEFYKELYFKENERRQEVIDALNIPIAIITALSTANYLFITTFDYTFNRSLSCFFIIIVFITFCLLIVSIYYLIKAFSNFQKGYEYKGLPYPGELNNWHDQLKIYNNTYNLPDNSDDLLKQEILDKLLLTTDHNTYVNDKKHEYIYNSKKYLVSLVISLLTLFPFGFEYFNKKDEIYKVDILQKEFEINRNDQMSTHRPVPPPPPPPPSVRHIKEGQEPPKPRQSK